MVDLILAGRTDVDDYFRLSGIRECKKLVHTPLLVFIATEDTVQVHIVENPKELLSYADETKVMGQWRGQWRSDFFRFTVGQLRQYLADHPRESSQVI